MAKKRRTAAPKHEQLPAPTSIHSQIVPAGYDAFLKDLKQRIHTAQLQAALAVNRELLALYWHIGKSIVERQQTEGWGNAVIDRLGKDLQAAFSGLSGFSRTNVYRMRAFYLAYRSLPAFVPQPVGQMGEGQVPPPVADLPWGHNVLLIEKIKDPVERLWYAHKAIEHGWSRAVLDHQIDSDLYRRQGKAATNFERTLPPPQSDLAQQTLKNPYNFDVRHDNRDSIADAVSRTLGRRCLSQPTYLKSKDNREHSLLVKRRLTTKCPDHAPQGLRSTVKAILLELQFQSDLR
jgi:predicted nuclease of restriction endonuclease-like (RecB) superfamily